MPGSADDRLDPQRWNPEERAGLVEANGATARRAASGERAVAAQFPCSAFAAHCVLDVGGTAADAFVAAALVDTVMTAGASSLGGMLDVLVRPPVGDVVWLDAHYRVPLGEGDHGEDDWAMLTTTGRAALVPGMLRGLESLWRRFGRLDWADLFTPARHFAESGFAAYPRLAQLAALGRPVLSANADASAAYLPDGHPVQAGELVRQLALARTLATAAEQGADGLYLGPWGDELVRRTGERQGVLTPTDVAGYAAEWAEPMSIGCYGHTVYVGGATTTGSLLLRSLKTCEALALHDQPLREVSGATLYAEMQADAYAWEPPIFHDRDDPNPEAVAQLQRALSQDEADRIARLIEARVPAIAAHELPGTHAIAVVDSDGMAVTGSHSISWTAWGSGVFVGGVPLNAAAYHLIDKPTRPGRPVLGVPSASVVATSGVDVLAAAGTNHYLTCSLQNLNDILGHGFAVDDAIGRPRWGAAAFDTATRTNTLHLHCELAIPETVAEEAASMGQPVKRADGTGLGYWTAAHRTTRSTVAVADPRFRGAAFAS